MYGHSFVDSLAAWATAAAALATVASAIVIAFQAFYTRRSTRAAEHAVQLSREALDESQKARLDASVPRFFVTFDGFRSGKVATYTPPGEVLTHSEPDHIYRMPLDGDVVMRVTAHFSIRNDGPGTLAVRFSEWAGVRDAPSDLDAELHVTQTTVRAGEQWNGFYEIDRPVSEWVEGAKSRTVQNKLGTAKHQFHVRYNGPGDMDVDVVQVVEVHGSPLLPVQKQDAAWKTSELLLLLMQGTVAPAQRKYWRSRAGREAFK